MKSLFGKTILVLFLSLPAFASAQNPLTSFGLPSYSSNFHTILAPSATTTKHSLSARENQCLRTGQWIGLFTGAGLGILHTYWSIKYTPDKNIPIWKHLVAGIPATLISSYVGSKTMRWATDRIMAGKPKPLFAVFKGAFYGAIAGTIILASNYIPLFVASHYLGTIHFNKIHGRYQVLKLIGISILGSVAYGGTFGAIAGAVYGPCISLYLKF